MDLIKTKPDLPVHPHIAYINSLPPYQLRFAGWASFTEKQIKLIYPNYDLPKKGHRLIVQFPNEPICLIDIVKLPTFRAAGEKKNHVPMWGVRYFTRPL